MLTVRRRFRIVTERKGCGKTQQQGMVLAEMRGTEFAGSNPVYPMWWDSTQYLFGDAGSDKL